MLPPKNGQGFALLAQTTCREGWWGGSGGRAVRVRLGVRVKTRQDKENKTTGTRQD